MIIRRCAGRVPASNGPATEPGRSPPTSKVAAGVHCYSFISIDAGSRVERGILHRAYLIYMGSRRDGLAMTYHIGASMDECMEFCMHYRKRL